MYKNFKRILTLIFAISWFLFSNQADAFLLSKPKTVWPEIADHFDLPSSASQLNVKRQIYRFLRYRGTLYSLTNNAYPYIYYIYQEARKRHMPAEIALLPMIESNFQPFTYSSAGAVGLWQLMPGTASGFGIRMNWWYDGRRDTIAATKVALNYLNYLHQFFNGNWLLAIAAYDAGEGTILNAIRYNAEHHRATDFWSLPLPKETRIYVPRLLALAHIIDHPDYYHVKLSPVPNRPITAKVTIHQQMNLSHIAADAGISVKNVRYLNPGFRRLTTPPGEATTILLPISAISRFLHHLQTHYKPLTHWIHYTVKSGDTLGGIALRFKTTVIALKLVNHLKHDVIHIKQALLIPKSTKKMDHIDGSSVSRSSINEDHIPGPKRITHKVKPGDSLWSIAKKYQVKIREIRYWNNLSTYSNIHPKETLVIWKRAHHAFKPGYHVYKVKSGDSLSIIAERHEMTTKQLMQLNHLKKTALKVGQQLRVPNT